jgi:hypothetical protein
MRTNLDKRILVVTGSMLLVVGLAAAQGSGANSQRARPNVLVIMTDDQTVESLRVMANVTTLPQACRRHRPR